MEHVVFAVGADGPGRVAALTAALLELDANLLDCSMTILSGHFAVVLVLDTERDGDAVERALAPVAEQFELAVTVRAVAPSAASGEAQPSVGGESHVVSVHGADRPGIVARVTATLAARGVNIVDLATRRVGESAEPAYVMTVEVVLPSDLDPAAVADDLARLRAEVGVDAHIHAVDADIL
jgi:glycine cleavage system transcriptional repressor